MRHDGVAPSALGGARRASSPTVGQERGPPRERQCGREALTKGVRVHHEGYQLAGDRGDGWFEVATRGSHMQFKHATKTGRVTVAGHPNDDLAPGTLKSILEQPKLKEY
ncbi:MAG TPA: type II toxin-antitoxin system HicA family toxin [Candidatus Acidoferrum sp.]|nr:type II toxin-antitoxin system HicA family toxin [Candidatus Acidoferrum sp.]